jgi:hypothetical protein
LKIRILPRHLFIFIQLVKRFHSNRILEQPNEIKEMAFLLPLLSASLIGTGLSFAHRIWPANTQKYAPCATYQKDVPENDQIFTLPNGSNICETSSNSSNVSKTYSQYYFSPKNNFYANSDFGPVTQGLTPFQPFVNGIQEQYVTFAPKDFISSTWPNGQAPPLGDNVYAWIVNLTTGSTLGPSPLNFMPQQYGSSGTITSASSVSLPLDPVSSKPLETIVWAIPGPSSAPEANNVPYNIQNLSSNGITTTTYLYFTKQVTIYLEIGGARGGSFTVYANGVSPETGIALPLSPGFTGGAPGIVYGLYTVAPGDVLKICLGVTGQERNDVSGALEFGGLGQGGFATIFGGANGGGASYAYHFKCPNFETGPFDALNNALSDSNKGIFVCCAAGGGGASRNASAGSAGFSEEPSKALRYGASLTTVASGSAGGLTNFTGPAPFLVQAVPNDLSGGGGLNTIGGQSNVPDQTPAGASSGSSLKPPFLDSRRSGGGSVVTSSGSGGGGGGGGLNGGGAGGWNGLPKPNNLHGAGGGGSSTFGLLKPVARGTAKNQPINFNVFRGLWPSGQSNVNVPVWNNSPDFDNNNGYFVLGLPQTA